MDKVIYFFAFVAYLEAVAGNVVVKTAKDVMETTNKLLGISEDSYVNAYSSLLKEKEHSQNIGMVQVTAKDAVKNVLSKRDGYDGFSNPPLDNQGYPGEYSDAGSYNPSGFGDGGYTPPSSYGVPPSASYGAPPPKSFASPSNPHTANSYSSSSYLPPAHNYGPPAAVYGPPRPVYGPPLKPSYGIPYKAEGFFDKFSLKLDILTIAKIILKLLIFKKIVKFIAVICLLLFIPKLIHIKKDKHEEYEDRRLLQRQDSDDEVTLLEDFVDKSISAYKTEEDSCEGFGCRMHRVLDVVDNNYPYSRLVQMYQRRSQ